MKGLEAIAFHNGWNISAAGIFIVFSALVTLSFIISQLHKILMIWEQKEAYFKKLRRLFTRPRKTTAPFKIKASETFIESARQFNLLVQSMKEPFSLPKLITLAQKIDLVRPFSTVHQLLSVNIIVPDGKGFYYWDHEAYKNIRKEE